MAPSAVTKTIATKTAAVIQEVNDEKDPGWIFGTNNGTVASVVTDRNDLWDELVVDSGSVSTARPHSWCADIGVNDKFRLMDHEWYRWGSGVLKETSSVWSSSTWQTWLTRWIRWER